MVGCGRLWLRPLGHAPWGTLAGGVVGGCGQCEVEKRERGGGVILGREVLEFDGCRALHPTTPEIAAVDKQFPLWWGVSHLGGRIS